MEGICLFSNGSCRKMSLLELSVCLSRFSGVILVYLVEGVGCVLGRADAKTCKEKKSFVEDLSIWFGRGFRFEAEDPFLGKV